ncbi:MAG TPA: hypothetical protein VNK04_07015 [Gemmataceae bacterium]|nr:hypothetical protein [Gemmataceae bacterium]
MKASAVFWLPKAGTSADEYEDACAADPDRGYFAIADGASESSFARQWAELLVQQFVRAPAHRRRRWVSWLRPLQQQWLDQVGSRPLPWYAEMKLKQGAFAAFLGLVIRTGLCFPRMLWRAVAVGDSCLFHLGSGNLRTTFPLTRSAEFGTSPWLVGSRSPPEHMLDREKLRVRGGCCKPGDRFYLMTDALACWFLREYEADRKPWEAIDRFLDGPDAEKAFADWISDLRDKGQMRNDDVTLLVVQV